MNLFGLTDKDLNEKLNYQGKYKIDSSVFKLTDIMQIIAMEKKNIAIKVINENRIGVIIFKNGDPIYSKLNEENKTILKGIEAAYKILSWNKPTFKLEYLSKNVSNNLNTNLINLLMGAIQYKFELTDIMRIVAMKKKNIAIKITNENGIGFIVFKNGNPICSKLNKDNKTILKGIEAAYKILSWNKPAFELTYLSKDSSNNLNIDLMNLLMGAMQYKDELLAKEQGININIKNQKEEKEFFNMDYSFDINENNNLKNEIKENKEEFIKLKEKELNIFNKFDIY